MKGVAGAAVAVAAAVGDGGGGVVALTGMSQRRTRAVDSQYSGCLMNPPYRVVLKVSRYFAADIPGRTSTYCLQRPGCYARAAAPHPFPDYAASNYTAESVGRVRARRRDGALCWQ